MKAIFERELKSYFTSMTGYLFCAFLLLFIGIFTMAINLKGHNASFEYVFSNMSFIFLIIVPILTMRTIADEKKQKTDQLLYTLPISMNKIVIAKYLALLVVLAVPLAIAAFYPLIISLYGTISFKVAYCSILGFFFLGAALIAIGMFVSSLTENQAIAAVLCFFVLLLDFFIRDFALYFTASTFASFMAFTMIVIFLAIIVRLLTRNGYFALIFALFCELGLFLTMIFSDQALVGLFPAFMRKIAVFDRLQNFVSGMFDLSSLVYFLVVILLMVFLTIQSLERRRWN